MTLTEKSPQTEAWGEKIHYANKFRRIIAIKHTNGINHSHRLHFLSLPMSSARKSAKKLTPPKIAKLKFRNTWTVADVFASSMFMFRIVKIVTKIVRMVMTFP